MTGTPAPLRDRLYRRLIIDPSGCLLWAGARNYKGYGTIGRETGRSAYVHRVAWELLYGQIPDGMVLDHLCRVRHCGNAAHLEVVTNEENIRRGVSFAVVNAAKTHCDNGHAFNEKNTRVTARGWRICRPCSSDEAAKRRKQQRAIRRAELGPRSRAGTKLTAAIADQCRARNAAGESQAALAREFGVHSTTMYYAIRGRDGA